MIINPCPFYTTQRSTAPVPQIPSVTEQLHPTPAYSSALLPSFFSLQRVLSVLHFPMTLTSISVQKLPSSALYLNSVCPVISTLDENVHFLLDNQAIEDANGKQHPAVDYGASLKSLLALDWPLVGSKASAHAELQPTYLNIARPPLSNSKGSHESTTYVSLPFHVTELFRKIVVEKERARQVDGGMHIGANINPLIHDPFKLVLLNPSCITTMVELDELHSRSNGGDSDDDLGLTNSRNPFNKMTASFNKLLKITTSSTPSTSVSSGSSNCKGFLTLQSFFETGDQKLSFLNSSAPNSVHIFDKMLVFDPEAYSSVIANHETSKLMISSHINVINVFAIDKGSNYTNTKQIKAEKPILPTSDDAPPASANGQIPPTGQVAASASAAPTSFSAAPSAAAQASPHVPPKEYTKVVETPILRFQLHPKYIVTQLKSYLNFRNEPFLLIGLDSGDVIIMNLVNLNVRVFDNLGFNKHHANSAYNIGVTSLKAISHPKYELLIVAGFANGEVIIINPYDTTPPIPKSPAYTKKVVGKDEYITYFKKSDLSFNASVTANSEKTVSNSPPYIVSHFKLSHKPITAIASTMSYTHSDSYTPKNSCNPMIIAFGSDDGLLRLIDLVNTFEENYGDGSNPLNNQLITDIIANYFHDGINDIQFSPDFKFLCMVGRGDLIEIFKMSFYNVNGLLTKQSGNSHQTPHVPGRRSRSGTVNSTNSGNGINYNMFLSPSNITPSNSIDLRVDESEAPSSSPPIYPPIIKEVTIVGRFKGHTNTVGKIQFVKSDQLFNGDLEPSASPIYKLASTGNDGKVIFWEFDYKALPKVKKVHHYHSNAKAANSNHVKRRIIGNTNVAARYPSSSPLVATTSGSKLKQSNSGTNIGSFNLGLELGHSRNHSWNFQNDEFNNMNKFLSVPATTESNTGALLEQFMIVSSFYRSLFELRRKRHYHKLLHELSGSANTSIKKYRCIIHPIVNDKLVPSIEIPLLTLDLSRFITDGRIDGVHISSSNLWVFAKSGDIFKFDIK